MNKKGFELGINAIVILIIALVMLGLGIAFVTKIFNPEIIPELPPTMVQPTADQPITFEKSEVSVKRTKTETVMMGVYNAGFSPELSVEPVFDACKDSTGTLVEGIQLVSSGVKIPEGEFKAIKGLLSATPETPAATYICTVSVPGTTVSSQLIVIVTV